jgi:hypothetical protein
VLAKDIKADTSAIREDTVELKMGQEEILAKISQLHAQLPRNFLQSHTREVIEGYLDSLTTYAESASDVLPLLDTDKWSDDARLPSPRMKSDHSADDDPAETTGASQRNLQDVPSRALLRSPSVGRFSEMKNEVPSRPRSRSVSEGMTSKVDNAQAVHTMSYSSELPHPSSGLGLSRANLLAVENALDALEDQVLLATNETELTSKHDSVDEAASKLPASPLGVATSS